ncbi:MAG: alpha/beta hydrolase, partial [Methanobacteriaceae archaeon]|nr:alpha/beta hydrolase [Methanobacteriaceae archaeon]
ALLFLSNHFVNYMLKRSGKGANRNNTILNEEEYYDIQKEIKEKIREEDIKNEKFIEKHMLDKANIKADDGVNLVGYYLKQNDDSDKWAIVIHGYRETHYVMNDFVRNYFENGFNVLVPDLRGCGESEGEYITMGYLEKKDIVKWIDWILNINNDAKIVVHGRSMGAATTMMVSGIEKRKNVKCFIEDSGYTSAYDISKSELYKRFRLPSFPLLNFVNIISKVRFGFSLKDIDCISALKKCEKPILFIHGTYDDFVPFEMLNEVYNAAKTTNKEKIEVPSAGHVQSIYVLGDEYFKRVIAFINKSFEIVE